MQGVPGSQPAATHDPVRTTSKSGLSAGGKAGVLFLCALASVLQIHVQIVLIACTSLKCHVACTVGASIRTAVVTSSLGMNSPEYSWWCRGEGAIAELYENDRARYPELAAPLGMNSQVVRRKRVSSQYHGAWYDGTLLTEYFSRWTLPGRGQTCERDCCCVIVCAVYQFPPIVGR